MSDNEAPINRRQRRAAARENGTHLNKKLPHIKYAQPDRSGPKAKTLYDLAHERQAELNKGTPFEKAGSKTLEAEEVHWNDEPFSPAAEAFLWSFSLSMLHMMLDVLVNNQYRQDIVWSDVLSRFGTALPTFWFVVYLFHTRTASRFGVLRQVLFLGIAVTAGCWLAQNASTNGYYAVMKRAPPLGTVWIWAVVELELVYALISVVGVGGYIWWNGYYGS